MLCPARVMVPVWTQSWPGQSLSATRTLSLSRRMVR